MNDLIISQYLNYLNIYSIFVSGCVYIDIITTNLDRLHQELEDRINQILISYSLQLITMSKFVPFYFCFVDYPI